MSYLVQSEITASRWIDREFTGTQSTDSNLAIQIASDIPRILADSGLLAEKSASLGRESWLTPDHPIDVKIMEMCHKNNLSQNVKILDKRIYEIYKQVQYIKHRILVDTEIPNCERIRFEIHLASESSQILSDEKRFYEVFFKEIPEEKQDFFSFTYRLTT